jgi:hypothetical protein
MRRSLARENPLDFAINYPALETIQRGESREKGRAAVHGYIRPPHDKASCLCQARLAKFEPKRVADQNANFCSADACYHPHA